MQVVWDDSAPSPTSTSPAWTGLTRERAGQGQVVKRVAGQHSVPQLPGGGQGGGDADVRTTRGGGDPSELRRRQRTARALPHDSSPRIVPHEEGCMKIDDAKVAVLSPPQ